MQRAMHLAYPDTTRWWLEEASPTEFPEEVANRVLWRTYVWRFHPDEYHATWWRDVAGADSAEWRGVSGKTEPAPVNSMVLVVQPPWILALQDMKNFTKCTNVSVPMLVKVSVLCIDSDVCVPFAATIITRRRDSAGEST